MEMYKGSEPGTTETYMIGSTQMNSNSNSLLPPHEETSYMGTNVGQELTYDNGLYYNLPATNYLGYYCPGFESPGEWGDQQVFGLDGQGVPYPQGLPSESMPYVYYPQTYGYTQVPYNPYGPYFPGAVIGSDSPATGTQQYVPNPLYQLSVSSPAYIPVAVQSRSETPSNSFERSMPLGSGAAFVTRHDNTRLSNTINAASAGLRASPGNPSHGPSESSLRVPNGPPLSRGSLPLIDASYSERPQSIGAMPHGSSSHVSKVRSYVDYLPDVRTPANSFKASIPTSSVGPATIGSSMQMPFFKTGRRFQNYGVANNSIGAPNLLTEQNRGPRTNKAKSQSTSVYAIRAFSTKTGAANPDDNIIIRSDQYNRDDFVVKYPNAKFFVIKSYSEDDVHKSIKYNVWSSTPNGNKRLDSVYEDAQKLSKGKTNNCPKFLFFSVNASGHFCGVAEMIGPVDFQKDMDFWQQDKWTGSFPVKWHIVKDVPNSYFRHITLENNENKPVTNSRDTQEIPFIPGMEMLNIFKASPLRGSILDDFMYYEERQRIMYEDKSRLHGAVPPVFYPAYLPIETASEVGHPLIADGRLMNAASFRPMAMADAEINKVQIDDSVASFRSMAMADAEKNEVQIDDSAEAGPAGAADHPRRADKELLVAETKLPAIDEDEHTDTDARVDETPKANQPPEPDGERDGRHDKASEVDIPTQLDAILVLEKGMKNDERPDVLGSVSLVGEDDEKPLVPGDAPEDVVTVGSMRIKVNGFIDPPPPAIITVGSIPLEPNVLRLNKNASLGKGDCVKHSAKEPHSSEGG